MASRFLTILLVLGVLSFKASVEAWDSLIAEIGEPCGSVRCNPDKRLVCSEARVCECKIDDITGQPLRFMPEFGTCVPIARSLPEVKAAAQAQAQQQFGGDQSHPAGHGSNHGGGHHGGNQPKPNPGKHFGRIEGSYCTMHEQCSLYFGELSSCKLEYHYCICHAFKQQTGFYEVDRKCHYVFGLGERCDETAQCILGSYGAQNPVCRENPRNQFERICLDGHASGLVTSITLILFAIFATRVLANM